MSVQLHLPDLPEVPVAIGTERGVPCQPKLVWQARLRGLLASVLPVALMAILAVASWWLVKNSPQAPTEFEDRPPSHVPDYQVERFTLQRFDDTGAMSVQIEGAHMRHYPDTDEVEVDTVVMHGTHRDGRRTEATAREAIASGDGAQLQLVGGAHVTSTGANGEVVDIYGERLLVLIKQRRLVADREVVVKQGSSEYSAAGLVFDEASHVVTLSGPARALLMPSATRR